MARSTIFTFPAASTTAICAAQQRVGSGALVINGSLLDTGSVDRGGPRRVILPGIQRTVSLTVSGASLAGVNFTITGTNLRGAAVTETLAGPNNNTVETTAQYHTITSVTVNGTVGTDVSLGTGTVGLTNWFIPDTWQAPFEVGIQGIIANTISFDVVYTLDDVQEVASPTTTVVAAGLDDETANAWGSQTIPCGGLRGVINSSSGGGSLVLTFTQSGQ